MNSINMVSLDKSSDYQNKIQNSFVERITAIKDDSGTSANAFSVEPVKVDISALGAEELEKVRQSWDNHPVSALYRTDIPIGTNSDGVYRIGKVDFSEEEFKAARNLVTGMTGQLKQGALSYVDHTKMAVAENLVEKCASASFSDEQSQVIVRAMRDYNERLNSHNNELLSKSTKNDIESAKQYWGAKQEIPEEAKDAMEKLFGRRPSGTYAVTSIATNQELIDSLQQKAKEIDVTEQEGIEKFKTFYQNTMKPVYDVMYPDEMKPDSRSTIELDLYGSEGIMKMVDIAKQWLSQNR